MIWDLQRFSDHTAVITADGENISYQALSQRTERLADAVGGRCLVIVLCTNTLGSLLGYTAFLNHGIVPIMAAESLDHKLLQPLIETYQPEYLWVPQQYTASEGMPQVYADAGYVLLKTQYHHSFALYDELALLLTTSGSTGSPKLVRQSCRNIISNTEAIAAYLKLDSTERPITTLPMHYTYGLSIINSHLYVGASVILTDNSILQRAFWNQFHEYGATSFGGVPYTYEMLDRMRFFRMELPTLRTMTQAGGRLSQELHMKFAEFAQKTGRQFVVMYGQTEATARMAYLPSEKAVEKCGSFGIAIPGGSFTLIDADGSVIDEPEKVGELVYEGENVALGYAVCGEDLAKADEWHGRNFTGDMARRDADGFYYIAGRKKRFLKLMGSRVNLDETEHILKGEFPDADFACDGADDKMYVFTTAELSENALRQLLSQRLRFNPNLFHIVRIDMIPRNEAGKVLYSALEQYYNK